jgi:hypothetical protein
MSYSYFRKPLKASVLALTLALMLPGLAAAKDFCITINSSSYILTGKSFVAPMKGKCKPWTGLVIQSGFDGPSAGTACVSSDGTRLNLTVTTTFPEDNALYFDSISLALPSHVGTDFYAPLGSSSGTSYPAVGAACNPQPIPAMDFNSAAADATDREVGPGVPK